MVDYLSEDDELDNEIEELADFKTKNDVLIQTHERINQGLCGEIDKIEPGMVSSVLETLPEMVADSRGLIHNGFVFGAANYAAMVAVNERNVVLVASDCQFLSPAKLGDTIRFDAKVRHKEGKKRNVHVVAHVLDIKIFEGEFKTVITEKHILGLKLLQEE